MDIESALKNIGDWISKETELRKYPKSELLELSESLQVLKSAIARQSETKCKWKCRDDIEYFSECGFQMFRANNYSLSEDGFKYCPKCSKEISNITRYSFDDFVQIED